MWLDIQKAPGKDPGGEKATYQHQLASNMNEQPEKRILQPQSNLQMTAAVANV